ncbi:MAG: serine/threonine protein kinase, partial [Clostridiales bacterium]|nr:serine/threonine protein kinase [Clostridiales bacterium]
MENVIDNKYRLEQKIGSGGTSVVYRAVRLEDGKTVAVKLLKEEYCDNEEQVQRFLRESNALAHLSHENIVNILDVGQTEQGIYYIVMEYVDRLTLKEYIKARGRLSFDEIIDVVTQICEGLGHAHENGIIHRDIKPQNILLASDGTVKVADFGIARVLNQNTLTMAGKDVVGSVHYISPEQARGSHIDKRSDIYSLGVVMYEMATGQLPFEGEEAITVAMRHINQLPKRPIEINPEIPECLNNIILKCMAKDQAKRYQSISELHSDLLDAAENPDGFIVAGNSRGDSALRIGDEERSGNSGGNKRKSGKKNARDS